MTDPGNWHDVPEDVDHDDEPPDRDDVPDEAQSESWAKGERS